MNALQQIRNTAQSVKQGIGNAITDLPFTMVNAQNAISSAMLPHLPFTLPGDAQAKAKAEDKKYNAMTPMQQLAVPGFSPGTDYWDQQTKSDSAMVNPYIEPPPSDPRLEALRQQVLNTYGFRPAARSFFQNIPITADQRDPSSDFNGQSFQAAGEEMGNPQIYRNVDPKAEAEAQKARQNMTWEEGGGFGGQAPNQVWVNPDMIKGKDQYDPYAQQTLFHELIHSAPRTMLRHQMGMNALEQAKNDPFKKAIGDSYLANGQPVPNLEEFYATLAEVLGPSVVNDPQIGWLYKHIFQPNSLPEATINSKARLLKGSTPAKLNVFQPPVVGPGEGDPGS